MIAQDYDVSDLLNRIAVPRLDSIASEEHKAILQKVIEEKKNRIL
jgi:hypothetical protein